MKTLATGMLALALLLLAPVSWAQTQTPAAPPSGQNTPPDHGPDSGTAPGGRGSSGWTGGAREGGDDNSGLVQKEPADINAGSEYATGTDLKGPPARFPSRQTPE